MYVRETVTWQIARIPTHTTVAQSDKNSLFDLLFFYLKLIRWNPQTGFLKYNKMPNN